MTGQKRFWIAGLALLCACGNVFAEDVLYVDRNSANPLAPYASWGTAATTIQDAVESAIDGNLILVTNGLYDVGQGVARGVVTARVAVVKRVDVASVNGPYHTIIKGEGQPYGGNNLRCVYLTNGASLVGFTITNGHSRGSGGTTIERYGGGMVAERDSVVSNCVFAGNWAGFNGGAVAGGRIYNSLFTGNSANFGGAVHDSALYDCLVISNSAVYGGGATRASVLVDCILLGNRAAYGGGGYYSTLTDCSILGNTALTNGGGGANCSFTNCLIVGNVSSNGGGAFWSTGDRCVIMSNTAYGSAFGGGGGGACDGTYSHCLFLGNQAVGASGGGARNGTYRNCVFTQNEARQGFGGGASGGTFTHCTFVSNRAVNGCAASAATLYNCIAYYNDIEFGNNLYNCTAYNTCTIPLPFSGSNNITNEPAFVDRFGEDYRLTGGSPCIDAGGPAYEIPRDYDDLPRPLDGNNDGLAICDMGAFEYVHPEADTDGDRMTDANELYAGTDPTDPNSVLRLLAVRRHNEADTLVQWSSVTQKLYRVEYATTLTNSPVFLPVASNVESLGDLTSVVDTNRLASASCLYRVAVE